MNEKKCTGCGGILKECTLTTGLFSNLTVSIPNGYNYPTVRNVDAFICEKCGKIDFYAKSENG